MKKLLYLIMVCLGAACSSDDGPIEGDGMAYYGIGNLQSVESILASLDSGSIEVSATANSGGSKPAKAPAAKANGSVSTSIRTGMTGNYVVIADGLNIRNGSYIFSNVAAMGLGSATNGQNVAGVKAYMPVLEGQELALRINEIVDMYKAYKESSASDGRKYLDADGALTFEFNLWPGIVKDQGFCTMPLATGGNLLSSVSDAVEYTDGTETLTVKTTVAKSLKPKTVTSSGQQTSVMMTCLTVTAQIRPKAAK